MTPDPRFLSQPSTFWANVRAIGQAVGYTVRGEGQIKVPTLKEIADAYKKVGLRHDHIVDPQGSLTTTGRTLLDYFTFRADKLNTYVEPRLLNAAQARTLFKEHRARLRPSCPLPMNKQKGKKKAPAFLTGLVNMLIEANSPGFKCDYDPRALTTVTKDGAPLRTLARRVDGAFPHAVNPIAVWEIKEYYYTTTFGSRVADGVYETLLDGMELEELREHEAIHVRHYLIVDDHYTWWECGKSYLCRIVDMLHMGYVDEALFGREVVERLPAIVQEWCGIARSEGSK
ncbi:MAG: hypothetical protein Q7W02_04730 [Candidatus Rokubacteria bacterium]|nr:hypothetical protein [Candidatus Rokubacteria bacterium]